jgi:glutathione synthase/RimK-type ligase-like ATP-grasp enzyme
MGMSVTTGVRRVALVVAGDRGARDAPVKNSRLTPLIELFAATGIVAEIAVFADDFAEEVREQLRAVDVALVWVNPVTGSTDRGVLDALLRDVASEGVYVSAHPDVILRMGTKQVVYDTRQLGWGTDTCVYSTFAEFTDDFPRRLVAGPRVLKQHRGNGGIGVHKVELLAQRDEPTVRTLKASVRDAEPEDLALSDFVASCEKYFRYSGGTGHLIDQRFQPRINEGMIRCYFVRGEVVGFARQYPPAATADTPRVFGLSSDKTMYDADEPTFARLRASVETDWVPAMQVIVGVDDASLPLLWDADFLLGPKTNQDDDTYVLCEINVSAVAPFPPAAVPKLVAATATVVNPRRRPAP